MKPAIYKGITYNVPLWTRWLAEDFDGSLYAYELEPVVDGSQWQARCGQRSAFIGEVETNNLVEVE